MDKDVDKDIVDEALYYFKANVFFRTYEIKVRYFTFLKMTWFIYNSAFCFSAFSSQPFNSTKRHTNLTLFYVCLLNTFYTFILIL